MADHSASASSSSSSSSSSSAPLTEDAPLPVRTWDSLTLATALGEIGPSSVWQKLSNAVVDLEVDGGELCGNATSVEKLVAYAARDLKVDLRHGQAEAVLHFLARHANGDNTKRAGSENDAEELSDENLHRDNSVTSGSASDEIESSKSERFEPSQTSETSQESDIVKEEKAEDDDQANVDRNNDVQSAGPESDSGSGGSGADKTSSLSESKPGPPAVPATVPHKTVEDVLQALRARSVNFCDRHPRFRPALLQMPGLFMPNGSLPFCFACDSDFTLLHRRHHCRLCGLLFCKGCSATKMRVPSNFRQGQNPVRVCNQCLAFGHVLGTGCGEMDNSGVLSPLVVHAALCGFTPVDRTAESQAARNKGRAACRFFGLDPDAGPTKLTRQAAKKAYMNKLRDAHPDTGSNTHSADPFTASLDQSGADPTIADVKAQYAILQHYIEGGSSGGGDEGRGRAFSTDRPLVSVDDSVCGVCLRAFKGTTTIRRHHCRRCGQAVCDSCSPELRPLPEYGFDEPVRQCNSCVEDPSRFAGDGQSEFLKLTDQVYPDGHEYLRDATPTASVVASDVIAAQLHPNGLGPRAAMMAALAKASDELASGIDVDTARAASGRTADRNSKGKGADVFVIKLWYATPEMDAQVSVHRERDDPNAVHGSLLPTPADVDVPPDLASYSVEVQRTMADFQWLYKRLVAAGHSTKRLPPLQPALDAGRKTGGIFAGISKKQGLHLKQYALQASALNVFIHALVRHPILRNEKWVWTFLSLSRRDLADVQSVSDAQSSKQQQQSHYGIPLCDPTRPLLPAFETYFQNLPQWLAFRVQTAMFGRVNSQLRFRLKASEARFERLTYRTASQRDRRHLCQAATLGLEAMEQRSAARLAACTAELAREQQRLQSQRSTPLLHFNDRAEDIAAHSQANDQRRADRRAFEQLKAQFFAAVKAWKEDQAELTRDQLEWESQREQWVAPVHRWMLENCQRAFPPASNDMAELEIIKELQNAEAFYHDEMAAFFEKVRTEEVAMEEEKIRLAEDARREMAATAKALARGLPRGDETSDWRRVTRPLFADNEQHYAESNQVKGENEVVLANSRDDDEQRSDECHSIGWWKIEDDVFENCEDTRAQEIALRSEKERVIETDVAAREKEVALRRSQQAQRKDDRTKRAEAAEARSAARDRRNITRSALDESVASVVERSDARIDVLSDQLERQRDAEPLVLKFDGIEAQMVSRRADHADLERCDTALTQQQSTLQQELASLQRELEMVKHANAGHAADSRHNEAGNPRTEHEHTDLAESQVAQATTTTPIKGEEFQGNDTAQVDGHGKNINIEFPSNTLPSGGFCVPPADKFYLEIIRRRAILDAELLEEYADLQAEKAALAQEQPAIRSETNETDAERVRLEITQESLRSALGLLTKEKALHEAEQACRDERILRLRGLFQQCVDTQNRQVRCIEAASACLDSATATVRQETQMAHEARDAHRARVAEYQNLSRQLEVRLRQHAEAITAQQAADIEERLFHEGVVLMQNMGKQQKRETEHALKASQKSLSHLRNARTRISAPGPSAGGKHDVNLPGTALDLVKQAAALSLSDERPNCHAQLLNMWENYMNAKERAAGDAALLAAHDVDFFRGFNRDVRAYQARDAELAGRFHNISDRGTRLGEELAVFENLLDEATGLLECSEGPVAEEALQLLQRESDLIRQQISLREEKEARIDARFREAERVVADVAKACQRCHKKLDETARAMSSAKQLHKIQATTRHNLGDLRQLTQEAHRTAAAVANTSSVAVSGRAANNGYAQSELDAAARRLDTFFKTAQTAKRDLHQLRELQARLWDDLQLQQRHLEGVRIDADNAEAVVAALPIAKTHPHRDDKWGHKMHKRHHQLKDHLRTKIHQVIAKASRAVNDCTRHARESAQAMETVDHALDDNLREYERASNALERPTQFFQTGSHAAGAHQNRRQALLDGPSQSAANDNTLVHTGHGHGAADDTLGLD